MQDGWNRAALLAVTLGVLPCVPGLLASVGAISSAGPLFSAVYDCAWFVGVGVSVVAYSCCMKAPGKEPGAATPPGSVNPAGT